MPVVGRRGMVASRDCKGGRGIKERGSSGKPFERDSGGLIEDATVTGKRLFHYVHKTFIL
jgi:hypothetical protein